MVIGGLVYEACELRDKGTEEITSKERTSLVIAYWFGLKGSVVFKCIEYLVTHCILSRRRRWTRGSPNALVVWTDTSLDLIRRTQIGGCWVLCFKYLENDKVKINIVRYKILQRKLYKPNMSPKEFHITKDIFNLETCSKFAIIIFFHFNYFKK